MSALAKLRESETLDSWLKITINEHQVPLKETWKQLLENAFFEEEAVWEHFSNNPMVTVLKSEDDVLNTLGFRSSNSENRYLSAGIEVIHLSKTPETIWAEKIGLR